MIVGFRRKEEKGAEGSASDLEVRCLTVKHKPTDKAERARIQAAGGVVLFDRLGGQMAVSRSFGDKNHKAPYNGSETDHMSVVPYINVVDLNKEVRCHSHDFEFECIGKRILIF